MKILIWILTAILQALVIHFNIFDVFIKFAERIHLFAYHFIERQNSPWNWFYEALLIGRDEGLRAQPQLQSFFTLGLYHLIVVSGSHVLAIEKMVTRFLFFTPTRIQKALSAGVLILFCLANRLQASCVRAFISWIFNQVRPAHLNLQGDIQLIVTLFCLAIQPKWLSSLSFQLSCGATLGLAIASSMKLSSSLAQKAASTLCCACITSPLILSIQPCLSWLVVPSNIFAMPLFEGILMPLSLLNTFVPSLSFLGEKIFQIVFSISDALAQFEKPLMCLEERRFSQWGFIYLSAVFVVWRFALPSFLRLKFWQTQNQKQIRDQTWGESFTGA